ncbi:MAG: VanZ family protein [Eubacterium sp.]
MQTERIKSALLWFITVLCMGVIFWLSSRTAQESSEQSSAVLEWLIRIFGDNLFTDFIVRKLAHCLEFTGLCFLLNLSLLQSFKKKMPLRAILFTSLYAVTDEVHQLFVEGRSCQISDWAIDTAGAVIGALAFILVLYAIKCIKKKNCIDTVNN